MAGRAIFLKKGFMVTGRADPDFELLALKFDPAAPDPAFREGMARSREKYGKGLFIFRSAQCPYSMKNVAAIMETARSRFGIDPVLVELEEAEAAENSPCAFGTFCILLDSEVISHHPISNTRFENIMVKQRKGP
jgi:hypothetical protein